MRAGEDGRGQDATASPGVLLFLFLQYSTNIYLETRLWPHHREGWVRSMVDDKS